MEAPSRHQSNTLLLIYVVAFVDLCAAGMVVTMMPIYFKDHVGFSAPLAGFIMSIYGTVQFLSSPFLGGYADVHGYGPVLTFCLFACVPAYVLLAWPSWVTIVVGRSLAGIFKHTQNLSRAVIGAYLPPHAQLNAFGRLNAMGNVGFIVAPFVAGHLAEKFGMESVFLVAAAIYAVNGYIFAHFYPRIPNLSAPPGCATPTAHQKDEDEQVHSPSRLLQNGVVAGECPGESAAAPATATVAAPAAPANELVRVWRLTLSVKWHQHWDVFACRLLMSFAILLYRSTVSWVLTERFEIDSKTFGYLTSFQGLVSFVTSFMAGAFATYDPVKVFAFFTAIQAVSFVGLITAGTLFGFVIHISLLCGATSFTRAVGLELTTSRCSATEVGLLMGLSASLISVARSLSPLCGGLLHDFSPDLPGAVAVVLSVCCVFITLRYSIRIHRLYKNPATGN